MIQRQCHVPCSQSFDILTLWNTQPDAPFLSGLQTDKWRMTYQDHVKMQLNSLPLRSHQLLLITRTADNDIFLFPICHKCTRFSTVMHVSSLKICQPSKPNKHKITLYPYHSISACAMRKTSISCLISDCVRILHIVANLLLQNSMLFIFWQLWFTLQLKQQLPG